MKSSFETPPYSTHVEVGGQAELRCHPPLGNPEPVVTAWLRNGVPIDPAKDTNFIISATGRFIPRPWQRFLVYILYAFLCQFVLYGRHPMETECTQVDSRLRRIRSRIQIRIRIHTSD
jgi:hypothetical protein